MNARTITTVVVAALLAGGLVYAIGRYQVGPTLAEPGAVEEPDGPAPKAVTDAVEFQFGVMEVGAEMTHTFTIRNEGDAPLTLKNDGSTCSCTVNGLEESTIQPGEEAPVTLTWTPKSVNEDFSQGAKVRTNDPRRERIQFNVHGIVDESIVVDPPSSWDVGSIAADGEAMVRGVAYSRLVDEFAVEIEEDDDLLEVVDVVPMTDAQLADYNSAKSGWVYRVRVRAGKANAFIRTFNVKTDVGEEGTSRQMKVSGHAQGPVSILPIGNVSYYRRANAVDLGRFPAADGKSAELAVMVRGIEESDVEMDAITISDESLSFELTRDKSFRVPGKVKYIARITFDPGGIPDTKSGPTTAKIVVPINHPDQPTIEFKVAYAAE